MALRWPMWQPLRRRTLTLVKTTALPALDGVGSDEAWKQAPEAVVTPHAVLTWLAAK